MENEALGSASLRSSHATTDSIGRVPEFDGLRGVLAWFVVLVHVTICCGWFGPNFNGQSLLSEVAESALNLYILLSGFAITRLLMVEREPFGQYLWRRACRIVPPYWVALTAAIVLNGWLAANLRQLPPSPDTAGLVMVTELGASRIWIDSILHYSLLHGLAPVPILPWAPFTFLGVAWSLSLEWQFYCLAPLVLALATRSRFAVAALIVIAAAGLAFANHWMHWFSVAFIGIKGGLIVAGALTFFAARRSSRSLKQLLWPAYIALFLWWFGSGRAVEAAVTALGWTMVIAAAFSNRATAAKQFLNSRPLQYLGRVSYSTYLFHVPLITVLQRGIWKVIDPPTQLQLFAWTLGSSVLATLVLSAVAWRLLEVPSQRLGRRPPTLMPLAG